MRSFTSVLLLLLASIMIAGCSVTAERSYDAFNRYVQNADRDRVFQLKLATKYESTFGGVIADLPEQGCSDDDRFLFRAAFEASFFSLNEYTQDMEKLLHRMERCGTSNDQQFSQMFEVYVKQRAFDRAQEVRKLHPLRSMEDLPKAIDGIVGEVEGGATEWVIDENARVMRRQVVNDLPGARIVVMSHPQCHFSQNAMEAIANDPELSSLFSEYGKWVAPPMIDVSFDVLQRWNVSHPKFRHSLAHSGREWTFFSKLGTPTFYFVRDGKVVDLVEGWPSGGRRDEILLAARRAGFMR